MSQKTAAKWGKIIFILTCVKGALFSILARNRQHGGNFTEYFSVGDRSSPSWLASGTSSVKELAMWHAHQNAVFAATGKRIRTLPFVDQLALTA